MNRPSPNLTIHHGSQRTLIPWAWLLRAKAEKSDSSVTLVFTGLKLDITTPAPFDLLDAIEDGKVRRMKVQPKKPVLDGEFAIDAVEFREEDDE